MKRFFSVFALMFLMVFSAPDATAKKFGGGKSFGKSYKTAPAPKAQPTNTSSLNKSNSPASASKKGLMGGLLGGLLAGGLLAALFGSGAFEGFQFMDFIIIAVIAFVIFKIFKMIAAKKGTLHQNNHQAYAGGAKKEYFHEKPQDNNASFRETAFNGKDAQNGFSQSSGFAGASSDVPFNFPPNFDSAAFVNGAREHYRVLQEAWNHNHLEKIQEYVTSELYNDLMNERRELDGEQHTEVMFVDAEIVRADHDAYKAQVSVKFSGRYRDTKEALEENITDIWHLERDLTQANAPWLIVGIEA